MRKIYRFLINIRQAVHTSNKFTSNRLWSNSTFFYYNGYWRNRSKLEIKIRNIEFQLHSHWYKILPVVFCQLPKSGNSGHPNSYPTENIEGLACVQSWTSLIIDLFVKEVMVQYIAFNISKTFVILYCHLHPLARSFNTFINLSVAYARIFAVPPFQFGQICGRRYGILCPF